MGHPMAANIARAGQELIVFDKAGTECRAPEGTLAASSIAEVAKNTELVFVSVPDGPASFDVVRAILIAEPCATRSIINLSTTGSNAVRSILTALDGSGIEYIDAPVSGGRAGAIKGTITVMWSGNRALFETLHPVLEMFSKSIFYVGEKPGQGQVLKLLNNFLSAAAMAATSEAVVFGESNGIDMKTMIDVINVSTGRNTASSDKFPNRIMTGSFDAGFRLSLMEKDVALYLEEVLAKGTPHAMGQVIVDYLKEGIAEFPDGDFTEIYKFIAKDKA